MSFDDICKIIAIKQAQNKKDSESVIALDYLKIGKNHKSFLRKKQPNKPVKI